LVTVVKVNFIRTVLEAKKTCLFVVKYLPYKLTIVFKKRFWRWKLKCCLSVCKNM